MLRMQLIGGLNVWLDDAVVEPPVSRRAWTLLAWLALHPGMQARSAIAAEFWPDVIDSCARASLRSAVWSLRRALGGDADRYVLLGRDRLGLRADAPISIDVREVERLQAAGRPADAAEIGCGELLAGFDDEWIIEARDVYRPRIIAILESLAKRSQDADDITGAVDWTRRQVRLDPFAEEPLRRLMRRLAAAGDCAAARTTYLRFRDRLARELQIWPSPETSRLDEQLQWPGTALAMATAGAASVETLAQPRLT